MRSIKVHEIKPGMVFDSAVYIDRDNVLVRAREPIKSSDIEKLLKRGIQEVRTDGKLMEPEAPPGKSDSDSLRLHVDYDLLRKNWTAVRSDLISCGEILKTNLRSLIDRKIFNNHEIIEQSQKIVSNVFQIPYYLLALHNLVISDHPVVHHAVRAAVYGAHLARAINLSRPRVQELFFGMLLMDVGMFFVPDSIRRSTSSPDPDSWKSLHAHPLLGYRVLVNDAYVKTSLAVIALQHHENYDGSGYPRSLRENQIDLLARIAAICDRFSALLEDRYHRAAMLPYDAMRVILGAEAVRFDPILLRAFLGSVSIYPIGSLVELSTGEKGLVLGCAPEKPLRPLVRIMRTADGKVMDSIEFLDLNEKPSVYIVRALTPAEAGVNIVEEI